MLTADPVVFGEADLTNCDREPIHIPGSIQPHGVLLVVDRQDLSIEQTAGDTKLLLGIDPDRLIGLGLSTMLDRDALAFVAAQLDGPMCIAPVVLLGIVPRSGAMTQDMTLSAEGRTVLVEFEPARRAPSSAGDPIAHLNVLLSSLTETSTVEQCCATAVVVLRAATGFDRSMVYRFQKDETGVVIAEDLKPGLEPYLGLHYPASDIPKQARELYKHKWLRSIPDVNYVPSSLRPPRNRRSSKSIDMSNCGLRSVSPIHLQYLRNMGTAASLVMSIICHGRLWGLLVLHHQSTPHHVAADLRSACETFARVFSLQIEAKMLLELSLRRMAARGMRDALVSRLSASTDVAVELATSPELLRYVDATGGAVFMSGKLRTVGAVPSDAEITLLIQWLGSVDRPPVFSTDSLSAAYPPAAEYADRVSGLLAVPLTRNSHDCILWFRAGYETTVRWAGDPSKPVIVGHDGSRLSPRGSFAEWRELTQMHSIPWSEVDLEAADALRISLLDVTQHKAYEESLRRATQEAQRANGAKSLFLANMSHEIRTPMNAIIGLTYLLEQTTSLNSEQTGFVAQINAASKSLLAVITDVLDLSKIEAGELLISHTVFSPGVLLKGLYAIMRVPANLKGITLQLDVPDDLPAALAGDAARLNQILTNLLSNAIKFTERGGVTLGVRVLGSTPTVLKLSFTVRDTGIGIDAAAQARLFTPFIQADESITRRYGGTGLGLSIIGSLAKLMGGTVGFTSTLGVGSEFRVVLGFEPSTVEALAATQPAPVRRGARPLAGVRVLVVDDYDLNLVVSQRILEQAGALVWVANNGQLAYEKLQLQPGNFDVVLMDVQMPILDGYAATRRIRADLGLRELPIIALTAGALSSERQRATAAGMNDFIVKPFDAETLVSGVMRNVAAASYK
jgi:light-regulated signal transduction histidine kinase (bacteriophytochrome)/CheY-like chemotaxis protein